MLTKNVLDDLEEFDTDPVSAMTEIVSISRWVCIPYVATIMNGRSFTIILQLKPSGCLATSAR